MVARSGRIISHVSKHLVIGLVFLIAVATLSGRVLMGQIEYFKSEIEMELAAYGITGASLESIEGGWQGFHPLLKIHGASLSIPGRSQALSINQLELRVKLISTLLYGELKLLSLHSKIEKLIIVRDESANWWLNDIALTGAQENSDKLDIYAFFDRLPDYVSIDIRLLQILDKMNDKEYLLQRAGLHSSSDGGQLSLTLDVQLPETLGDQLNFKMTGDSSLQKLYLEVDRLGISSLTELMDFKLPGVQDARVDLKSWVDMQQYQPRQVVNDASFNQVITSQLNSAQTRQQGEENETAGEEIRFKLRQRASYLDGDWQVDNEFSRLSKGAQRLPDFNARFIVDSLRQHPQLWVDHIDVKSLQLILSDLLKDEPAFEMMNQLDLRAKVKNFLAEFDVEDINRSSLSFDFEHLHSQRTEQLPSINGLAGQVQVSAGKGQLVLESDHLSADFGEFFRLPIKLNELNTRIRFASMPHLVLLQTDNFNLNNDDLSVEGRAWLEIPDQGAPFMGLRMQYRNGNGSATSRYLPVTILPPKTLAWLDSSIKQADLTQGDLLFHGRLQKLSTLQDNQSGEFHALFSAENPEIDIYGGWPSVEGGKGQVSFHNTSMDINFSQVKFASTEVDQVQVQIPNLLNAELFIDASTDSSADDLIDTLSALPVLNAFDDVVKQPHQFSGLVGSDVHIMIPLEKGSRKSVSVKADASLQNVNISIPEWMVELNSLNGNLRVDNEKLTAKQINGLYRQDPVQLDISSDSGRHTTDITMQGRLDTAQLISSLPGYVRKPVSGKSDWKVKVSIPNDDQNNQKGIHINASSLLKGTELDFARPLYLGASAQRPLSADIRVRNRQLDFDLNLKGKLTGSGKWLLDQKNHYQLQSMSVLFGSNSKASLPERGVALHGNLDYLDVAGWSNYFSRYLQDADVESTTLLEQIQTVEVNLGRMELAGQQISDLQLHLVNTEHSLKGSIASSLAVGSIEVPYNISADSPFSAQLESLHWQKSQSNSEPAPDISDMPNLNISSKLVRFDTFEFEDFKLVTRNQQSQFIIDQLDFSRDAVALKSSGNWQYNPQSKDHVSVFNIDIRGDNFGATVDNLGLGASIREGKVKFNGQIGWGGSLFDMNWPTLLGEVHLTLEDGYLRNVDPGAGRFVGLLSLNALPKRLFLDFGDVLNQGMQFNKIKGDFSINGEVMTTENASMDSESARVKIFGSTNLREKTYDQSMFIIPKIGETLPVIGSLAVSNAVGWGLLLLQKIFKKPIEKSVEIEYKVTGSWEDPKLVLIPKQIPQAESEQSLDLENGN